MQNSCIYQREELQYAISTILMRTLSLFLLTVLLAGCSAAPTPAPGSGDKLDIVATVYPLAYLAQRIGGDAVNVMLLTPAGSEPHDFEPTPQDVAAMQNADLLLLNGAALDTWAELVDRGPQPTLIMADAVPYYEVEHKEEIAPEEAEHAHGALDPHAWLDPVLAHSMAQALADELLLIQPERAEVLQRNLAAVKSELEQVHQEYTVGLATCRSRTIVVSHDAFGYLARRYDLTELPIAGLSPEEEPSPAQLAQIADAAKAAGVTTVFTESLANPKLAETLAQELTLTTAVLNPLEGLTADEQSAGQDLLSLMRRNLQNLRTALQCE